MSFVLDSNFSFAHHESREGSLTSIEALQHILNGKQISSLISPLSPDALMSTLFSAAF